jgi:hypothetical protein
MRKTTISKGTGQQISNVGNDLFLENVNVIIVRMLDKSLKMGVFASI